MLLLFSNRNKDQNSQFLAEGRKSAAFWSRVEPNRPESNRGFSWELDRPEFNRGLNWELDRPGPNRQGARSAGTQPESNRGFDQELSRELTSETQSQMG